MIRDFGTSIGTMISSTNPEPVLAISEVPVVPVCTDYWVETSFSMNGSYWRQTHL
jgi:hypothetical protein